ncbi:MAG: HAMP domain-containing protein [Deltaproteobacteria bacterium]|nr:HAMP domain-containing protein [Deltaproteobacteria bacterium]
MHPQRTSVGRRFWLDIFVLQTWTNVIAVIFILAFLWPALSFTPDQITAMAMIVCVLVAVVMPPYGAMFYRWCAPVREYLGAQAPEQTPMELRSSAFGAVIDLPRRQFLGSMCMWLAFGFPASLYIRLTFDDFSLDSVVVLCAAITSGGLLSSVIGFFALKNHLSGIRCELANSLPDPQHRRSAARQVSVRAKLFVSTNGLILVTLIFGVSVTNIRGKVAIEKFINGAQIGVLEQIAARVEVGADVAQVIAAADESRVGVVERIMLLDIARARAGMFDPGALNDAEIRAILGRPSGESSRIDTSNGFAWRPLPGDPNRVLVAVTSLDSLAGGFLESQGAFFALIGVALAAAVLIARFVAADFGSAIDALRNEVDRIAAGDLRTSDVYESEDDLGDLARSVQEMAQSLRTTVSQVVKAASRVDGTANAIERASAAVNEVASEQAQSIQNVSSEMDQVSLRAREISTSAQSLSESVDDSSTAIHELQSVGEELHDYTTNLSDRVDSTASSVAEMAGNIHEVATNTGRLSEAATGTVERAQEIAANSRSIQESAGETESLYSQVIGTAEQGANRVTDTISGMQVIHDSVDDASRVVRELALKTSDIGTIVTVINDIADRTSLLALNAAIIAAKAGHHGSGFAVVAAEIKALAEQVRSKTQEIDEVVSSVADEANRAVSFIDLGTASVVKGVELSGEAGVALEAISAATHESGARIHEIATAVSEQAKGASEVSSLIDHLNEEFGRIRIASDEEAQQSERVRDLSEAIQEIAKSVHRSAEEQMKNSTHLVGGIETVGENTRQINTALSSQSDACDQVVAVLELMLGRNRDTEESGAKLNGAMRELVAEAIDLRAAVEHFTLDEGDVA